MVKCWDLEYNKVVRHYHGHLSAVYDLALPEGDTGEVGTQFEAGTSVLRNPKPYRVIFKLRE